MRKRDLMWIKRGSGGSVELQDKTFTENGTYTPDAGYDGFGSVTVDVASSGGGSDEANWELAAQDGTTCRGEAINIPYMNSDWFAVKINGSETERYRVTVDGVEYLANASYGANGSYFTLEGYSGDLGFSINTARTKIQIYTMVTNGAYYAIKIERWIGA
jgi:hypothetical protein